MARDALGSATRAEETGRLHSQADGSGRPRHSAPHGAMSFVRCGPGLIPARGCLPAHPPVALRDTLPARNGAKPSLAPRMSATSGPTGPSPPPHWISLPVRAKLTGPDFGSDPARFPCSPASQELPDRRTRIPLPVRANSKARSPGLTELSCATSRVDHRAAVLASRAAAHRHPSYCDTPRRVRHDEAALEEVPTGLAKVPTRQDHALPAPGLSEGETGRSRMRSLPTNWWRDINAM
jgi:hypothetical protein